MNYLFLVLKFLIVCTPEYHLKIRKRTGRPRGRGYTCAEWKFSGCGSVRSHSGSLCSPRSFLNATQRSGEASLLVP